jgi:hypothetical protein
MRDLALCPVAFFSCIEWLDPQPAGWEFDVFGLV